MPPIYLASASPRRKEILEQIGLDFRVLIREVDENIQVPMAPHQLVELLSRRKAAKVAAELDCGLVIGSDTVVVWRNRVMGKPKDRAEAIEMLRCLQGDQHDVYSGLAVIDVNTGVVHVSHEKTRVFFRTAAISELEVYVDSGEPMDKAGAYAVQGLGAVFISGIQGCYYNVVGLPLARLAVTLKDFGIDVLRR